MGSDLIKDPANAGIQRLSKYYFFSVGSSFLEGKIGTVLPLNDNELLATYIEQHFPSVEVLTDQGFLVAELSSEHTLVWDENAAIYFYSPFGGDLISEMETLFKQTESTSLEHKDSPNMHGSKDIGKIGWNCSKTPTVHGKYYH